MSDEGLSIEGALGETTVPDLFRSLLRSLETGIVEVVTSDRTDTVYFSSGKIAYATSTDPDRGLCEMLLCLGELDLNQYERAVDELAGPRRIGSVLCDLGFVKPEELSIGVERQVARIVRDVVAFRSGDYKVQFLDELPRDIPTLQLVTERLILDGIRRVEDWSLISRGLGRRDRMIHHASGSDARTFHLDLNEEEMHVYSLVAEPLPIPTVCERSYLSNFATCRTLWALFAVNLIEEAEATDQTESREAEARERELEAGVEAYNNAFQSLFNIVFQALGESAYDMLDKVVGNLPPDVSSYLDGINLINEGRVDYDQLYDNLVASGAGDKAVVAFSVLNELFYAWILEIRSQLGPRVEPELKQVIDRFKETNRR